jgi:hypothetical protein
MKLSRLVPILLLLSLASCSSSTEPSSDPGLRFVAVDRNSPQAPDWATSPPTVRVANGRIDLAGIIGTGDPCYDLRAESDRDGQQLTLSVVARSQNVPCITVLASFAYTASLDDLAPGTYELVVEHAWEDHGGVRWRAPEVVLDQAVTVP